MREPYGLKAAPLYGVDDPAYRGFLTLTADKIRNIVRTGHRLGWQMCAHVTGDAGVDTVLDAVEAADADRPIRDRRFTLIHAYFANAEVARRAAAPRRRRRHPARLVLQGRGRAARPASASRACGHSSASRSGCARA